MVCKHFLDVVEKKQYGWFWVCPNGGKECHCRYALPPGYVLKSQMKALLEEEANKMPIEEEIESQCAKVATSTPMTPELFLQWKKKHMDETWLPSEQRGLRMTALDSSLFVDDAEAYEKYQREEPDVSEHKEKISLNKFMEMKYRHLI
ncbi:Zinc finger CCCH domain-containing protein 11 [Camellia lanceoleosa]|uniref:Zinc finger CCCH domain-containing protein 11 n=1 Tax=Camellia lanceoleosa TaxID=1840588 RepID=A0ACC0J6C6_9ERIC|nr:Zinc finger CCCH domain-containing protein 11 [Camellia lanceoleosa]